MTSSENYGEVLNLIKRRRRAARSLTELSEFLVSLPDASAADCSAAAHELIERLGRRYRLVVSSGCAEQADSNSFTLTMFDDAHVKVSALPSADDERREVLACLAAVRAALLLTAGFAPLEARPRGGLPTGRPLA